MTIWPRKHKRKTPLQAFTISKKIYHFGRSLKFCGTVHSACIKQLIFTHNVSLFRVFLIIQSTCTVYRCICPGKCVFYTNKDPDSKYRTHPAVQRSFCNELWWLIKNCETFKSVQSIWYVNERIFAGNRNAAKVKRHFGYKSALNLLLWSTRSIGTEPITNSKSYQALEEPNYCVFKYLCVLYKTDGVRSCYLYTITYSKYLYNSI